MLKMQEQHSVKAFSKKREADEGTKISTFSKKGHGQCIFTVSWGEIRKWPEPKGDTGCNV